MSIAALLSQYNCIADLGLKPKSRSKFRSHRSSDTPCAIPLYSASALEHATTYSFFLFQDTTLPLTNMQYPMVERLSNAFPAQSESVYPIIFVCLLCVITMP